MFKKVFWLLPAMFFLGGCSLSPRKSGIEVITYPTAKIFLDGKEAGMTPYRNSSLQPGEVEVKIVPSNGDEWTRKITLQNYTTTVIDRDFGKDRSTSGGYLLYMEKTGDKGKSGLIVNVTPDKSAVAVDNEIKGFSPIKLEDLGEGDKQVSLSFPGYKSINVFVKAIKGYQLIVDADLAVEPGVGEATGQNQVVVESTPGATLGNEGTVTIKETETGWLRVRETASSTSLEVNRVKPGEKYKLIKEENGWYQIEMDGKTGWISSRYASK